MLNDDLCYFHMIKYNGYLFICILRYNKHNKNECEY